MQTEVQNVNTAEVIAATAFSPLVMLSRSEIIHLAQTKVAESIGHDTAKIVAYAAKTELYASEVKKAAKEAAIADVLSYGREGVTKAGVKLVVKETGVRYDYSGDRTWQMLAEAEAKAAEARAAWEKQLKVLPTEGRMILDEETGELYRAYPPVKTASESIAATIL